MQSRALATVMLAAILTPAAAAADIFAFRFGPKFEVIEGSGDVYKRFDSNLGGGGELGMEILFIDLFAEAFAMGNKQWFFTVNAGFDTTIGDTFRLTMGLYTGPMFYVFPREEPEPIEVTSDVRRQLEDAGVNVDRAIMTYNDVSEQEADVSRLAFGWNVARARLELDMKLAPVVSFGIQGTAGYHFIISGEEVAAGTKNHAIDEVALEYGLMAEEQQIMRDLVGAEPVDTTKLDGLNYSGGVYFRFEI